MSATQTLHPIAGRASLRVYLRQIWDRREFIAAMPRHELHAQNLDTVLGNVWFLLNPMLLTGVYWLVFGVLLDVDRGADNYIPFLMTGVLLFRLWAGGATSGARIMWRNRGLVRSLYFPRSVLPIASALTEVLTFLPGVLILLVVAVSTGETPSWRWLVLPLPILLLSVFTTGTMFFTARLGHKFRDLATLLPHVTRLGLYSSGVLYDPERFTQNDAALLLFDINPLYQFITLARWCVIDIDVNWWFWITGPAWAAALLIGGFLYFWRGEMSYGSKA
ncbi:MAG: ABC transporter permease [Actinomycetota bacterium]